MKQEKVGRLILGWLFWRGLLILLVYSASIFIKYRPGFEYTHINFFKLQQVGAKSNWLSNWFNFDGLHYFNLSQRGYVNEARFLPFFPLMLNLLKPLVPQQYLLLASLVLNQILSLLSILALYRLLRLDYSPQITSSTI